MKVHLPKYGLTGDVEFAEYGNGEIAIILNGPTEVVAKLTVNLEGLGARPPGEGQVWVKTWAENEGADKALEDAGVALPTGIVFDVNPFGAQAKLMMLTQAARAELASQRGA